ncbi:hypothetical protein ACFL54_07370 [Planctomycetota bacterium]
MRNWRFFLLIGGLCALLVGVVFIAALRGADDERNASKNYNPAKDGFVVHEWGVLEIKNRSVVTSCSEELPSFVKWCSARQEDGTPTVRKPVIHFYSPDKKTVQVSIQAHNANSLCLWPVAEGVTINGAPAAQTNEFPMGFRAWIKWGKVTVLPPGNKAELRVVPPGQWWHKARGINSNLLAVGEENEKFLFYEVAGARYAPPINLRTKGSVSILQSNANIGEDKRRRKSPIRPNMPPRPPIVGSVKDIRSLFIIKVSDGKGQLKFANALKSSKKAALVADWSKLKAMDVDGAEWQEAGRGKLEQVLAKAGLFDKEARGVSDIWEEAFFQKEGIRALYVMPRAIYDKLFALTITEKPRSVTRVMIVCLE